MRPCTCNQFRRGKPFDMDKDCRACWLFEHDLRYRELWSDGEPGRVSTVDTLRKTPCIHLGMVINRLDRDGHPCMCMGKWLRACGIHGQCRVSQSSDAADCQNCEQYEPDL
jgi:hypothetical protein